MRRESQASLVFSVISSLVVLLGICVSPSAAADGVVFYEGELRSGGEPVSGWYDFEFQLYDGPDGGKPLSATQRAAQTYVQNGTFSLFLDFGDIADGAAAYVQVSVRPEGSEDAYTVLSPRQPVGAVTTSGVEAAATAGETWSLGVNAEGTAEYSAVIGRPAGETGAFRSDRAVQDIRFMFPAPATAKTIQSAQFYIVQRTGDYTETATVTLEITAFDGTLQHVASDPIDAKTAATRAWTSFTLGSGDDLVISPGEYLCVHFKMAGEPGGDLDVRPLFEIAVE